MQVVLALAAFLGISGSIGPFFAKRLRRGAEAEEEDRLAEKFPSIEQFNSFRQSLETKVEGCAEEVKKANAHAQLAIERADDAKSAVEVLQARQGDFLTRLQVEFLTPLQAVTETQNLMRENIAGLTALVKRLIEEWDHHRGGRP